MISQLQGKSEIERVGFGAGVRGSEDPNADQANDTRNAMAV
jgi:hypothetical protein